MFKDDMDFGQVQVMEFPWHLVRKKWDFQGVLDCHFLSNCSQKDMEKAVLHILQVNYYRPCKKRDPDFLMS